MQRIKKAQWRYNKRMQGDATCQMAGGVLLRVTLSSDKKTYEWYAGPMLYDGQYHNITGTCDNRERGQKLALDAYYKFLDRK